MDSVAGPSSQKRPLPYPPPAVFRPSSSFSKRNFSKRNSGHSSVFLPRLPEDPFSSSAFLQRDPIVVNSELLFQASVNSNPTRDVILVLGGQQFVSSLSLIPF
jgi:hypothetical protein